MIARREFITALGGAAIAWPLAARAQETAVPVIGFLTGGSPGGSAPFVAAFREGLSRSGYVEGRNVAIEYRWADGQNDRLPSLMADLISRRVSVIATGSNAAVLAAKAATTTLPIVFYVGVDPVAFGLAARLNRPGGNLTGVTVLNAELGPKRVELLHELVPAAKVIAALFNPTNPDAEAQSGILQAAARSLGLELHILNVSGQSELDAAFESLRRRRADALTISGDEIFIDSSKQLAELALRHAVPTIFPSREFAAASGLMSYGTDMADAQRLAGVYTGRVLKGEKPGDLPVQQATKAELILNLKTAKALGLTFPLTLLGRADEVIE